MDDRITPKPLYDIQHARHMRELNRNSSRLVTNIMGPYMDDMLPLRLRCECGRAACDVVINITLGQRRKARTDHPEGYIVVRDHVDIENQETVLLNASVYLVVVKDGD